MTPPSFDIQGHRGARGLYPENTIPGFLAALDIGVTTLEMDVVISRDEEVVVSHDPWMSRAICRRPDGSRIPILRERGLRIFDMLYREVREYDCGTLQPRAFKQQKSMAAVKPRVDDVIDAAEAHVLETGRPATYYSIETKARPEWDGIYHPDPETFADLLLQVLQERDVLERSIVQSFDVRTLQHLNRVAPTLRLSLLAKRRRASDLKSNLDALGFVPDIYSPYEGAVDEELVERAHSQDMLVIPWTVNEPDRMLALRDLGADGLITDYPDVAVRDLA